MSNSDLTDYQQQEQRRDIENERAAYDAQNQQEPDVVPCFKCNAAMYQESGNPEENICTSCTNQK